MRRSVTATIVLALMLAVLPEALAQSGRTSPDGSFSIALPSDWVAIPALELYLHEHPGRSGPIPPEELADFRQTRMAFQLPAERWFALPYMVLTLEKGRKRGPRDLFMESVMAERDADAAGGEGGRFLGKDHLPSRRVAYYKDVRYSPAHGREVAMGVYTYLTSQGFLRVSWFADAQSLAAVENALHQAAMSVKLSPELEYKPEGRKQ